SHGIGTLRGRVAEAAPKQVFLSFLFKIERINGVGYVYFLAGKYLTMVGKWACRLVGHGHTDTRIGIAPRGIRIVEVIFPIHQVYIRGPYPAVFLPRGLLF